jgi:hypothetical protein
MTCQGRWVRYRSKTRLGLRRLRIFADQSVEDLSAADSCRGEADDGWNGVRGMGWASIATLMGPVLAIVRYELTQDTKQVPRAVNQHPVQRLPAHGAYPPFRVCVRPRRLRWTAQDLDAFPVADQEAELSGPLPQGPASGCGPAEPPTPRSGGWSRRGCARGGSRLGQDRPHRAGRRPVTQADQFTLDRRCPQPGFSFARRSTTARIPAWTGGRPGWRRG